MTATLAGIGLDSRTLSVLVVRAARSGTRSVRVYGCLLGAVTDVTRLVAEASGTKRAPDGAMRFPGGGYSIESELSERLITSSHATLGPWIVTTLPYRS